MKSIRLIFNRLFDKKIFSGSKNVPETPATEPVYTDADGWVWRSYTDPLTMPVRRLVALEAATLQAELAITRPALLGFLEAMDQAANRGRIVELYSLLAELRTRLTLCVEEETLAQAAAVLFLAPDEPADSWQPERQAAKIERWRQDPEALGFFFTQVAHARQRLEHSLRRAGLADAARGPATPAPPDRAAHRPAHHRHLATELNALCDRFNTLTYHLAGGRCADLPALERLPAAEYLALVRLVGPPSP